MNKVALGALLIMGTVGVGSAAGLAIARAEPPKICERHVEYFDRPFGLKHIAGPEYEIYITACAVGPGGAGEPFILPPLPLP